MAKLRKSFKKSHPVPTHVLVAASSSMSFVHGDEQVEELLDMYERMRMDVRVYKLEQNLAFSDPNHEPC